MSFENIIGQDSSIRIIKELIRQSRFQGGYLFTGPEGVGKRISGITLAKALNCQNAQADSCDSCLSCLKIDRNEHPDVHFLDAHNFDSIKIEDIRQLKKDIFLKAYEAKIKVFIIDNAHNLTPEAANALLKVLEEPPGDSLIILITSQQRLLFKTVVSRCKILRFSALNRELVRGILEKDYDIDKQVSHFLAYFSEGRLGFALKLHKEGLFSDKGRIVDTFIIRKRLDIGGLDVEKREDVRKVLSVLICWFRDLYLIKAGIREGELVNLDQVDILLKVADSYSVPELEYIMQSISDSRLYLERNANIKLLLSNLKVILWKD